MSKKAKEKAGKAARGNERAAADAVPAHVTASSHGIDERRFLLISKALADPTRMAVLRKVAQGDGRCGVMRECLGISAATLSHHMKELENAGLVLLSREGRYVSASLEKKLLKKYTAELKSLL